MIHSITPPWWYSHDLRAAIMPSSGWTSHAPWFHMMAERDRLFIEHVITKLTRQQAARFMRRIAVPRRIVPVRRELLHGLGGSPQRPPHRRLRQGCIRYIDNAPFGLY